MSKKIEVREVYLLVETKTGWVAMVAENIENLPRSRGFHVEAAIQTQTLESSVDKNGITVWHGIRDTEQFLPRDPQNVEIIRETEGLYVRPRPYDPKWDEPIGESDMDTEEEIVDMETAKKMLRAALKEFLATQQKVAQWLIDRGHKKNWAELIVVMLAEEVWEEKR